MRKKRDALKPSDDDPAPEMSRSPASTRADTEERRQIIHEYVVSLRELIARLFRKRLH
jgi:hypothetical protein